MSLKDYLQKLQEEDGGNTVFSKPSADTTRVIPPKEKKQKPQTNKLKLKLRPKTKEEIESELFILSKTPEHLRDKWIEMYRKAKRSTKTNSVVSSMKEGKFRIDKRGDVVVLPNLDIEGTSDELLEKTWLRNRSK